MKKLLIFSVLLLLGIISCEENPIAPKNRNPVIFSLTAFPEIIGPSDSVIVICNAMDPDGDTLVYDWFADSRLRIEGSNDFILYHTSGNSRKFYPQNILNIPDTLHVTCYARDVKGGSIGKMVQIFLQQ